MIIQAVSGTMSLNVSSESQRSRSGTPAMFGLAAAIVLIAFVTLTPQYSVTPHHDIRVFAGWSRTHVREDMLNALLFAPLGVSARALHFKWRSAFVLAAGTSSLVELLQRLVVPGRFAELQDVVFNTAGAMIAYGFISLLRNVSHLKLKRQVAKQ